LTQIVLGAMMPLGCGPRIPSSSFPRVTRPDHATVLHDRDIELGLSQPPLGGPPVPHVSGCRIFRHSLAEVKKKTERDLRFGIASLGEWRPNTARFLEPAVNVGALAVADRVGRRRTRVSGERREK
jgi:hypothetical protein